MAEFLLVLYDNPAAFANVTPDQMQKVIEDYTGWAAKMGQEGRLVGGQKLTDEGGKIVRGHGEKASVVDGPYAETKEVIGGIFQIKADSYAEAVALSKTCPHLKYGPRIDVRQVDPMPS